VREAAEAFRAERLITEYIVSIIPVLLGAGIPLFDGPGPAQPLRLSARARIRAASSSSAMKQFSDACERNREPILQVLRHAFADRTSVLEIGSGTGQHAAYFAPALPHLAWQPSDVAETCRASASGAGGADARLLEPIELDVDQPFPAVQADAVFSANTCHIMSWPQVERFVAGVGKLLPEGGVFALYGPFHYGGKPTSPSNAEFDAWLRNRDRKSGVRDFEAIRDLAAKRGLALEGDNAMPANNRLLVFRRR